jgi:hypothetical protein
MRDQTFLRCYGDVLGLVTEVDWSVDGIVARRFNTIEDNCATFF